MMTSFSIRDVHGLYTIPDHDHEDELFKLLWKKSKDNKGETI